jgi:hypothetical protein
VVQSTSGKLGAQPLLEVDVDGVDVLSVDVIEDVVDELLLLLVETFPGEVPNSANAETATTTRTATARTAPRFTIGGISASPLKGSAKALNVRPAGRGGVDNRGPRCR